MIDNLTLWLAGSWGWLLMALAMVFVGAPLLRRHYRSESDLHKAGDGLAVNTELYQQQLVQFQQQLSDGDIDQQQYEELVAEQQRILLADANSQPGSSRHSSLPSALRGGWLLIAAMLLLPILALFLYQQLGASEDLAITQLLEQRITVDKPEDNAVLRAELIEKIAKRLTQQPEHVGYLVIQARLLTEVAQFQQAIIHYRQALELLPEDASLLAEYAQALYFAEDNRFTPGVELAMERALAIDPANVTVLGLQGIQSFSAGDYRQALVSWQQALTGTAPGSGQARALQSGIAQAKERLGESLPGVSLSVRLSSDIQVPPEKTVFIYAVEANASPMPLAITRVTAADLPVNLRLDDSMAMPGGRQLSSAETVQMIARVSQSGNAAPSQGDIEGRSGPVTLAEAVESIELVIDTVIP